MRDSGYSLREVQRMLGISRSVVERLISAGFISPSAGARRERRFSFQDVVMLRTAHSQRVAGVSPMKIVRALGHLEKSWAREGSLTGVRIAAVGARVAVRDGASREWDAESGQLLLDFEPRPACGEVASLAQPRQQRYEETADELFFRARALEDADLDAAEAAYRDALEAAPDYTDASLNLGCILFEAERYSDAIAVYRDALRFDRTIRYCTSTSASHWKTPANCAKRSRPIRRVSLARPTSLMPISMPPGFIGAWRGNQGDSTLQFVSQTAKRLDERH